MRRRHNTSSQGVLERRHHPTDRFPLRRRVSILRRTTPTIHQQRRCRFGASFTSELAGAATNPDLSRRAPTPDPTQLGYETGELIAVHHIRISSQQRIKCVADSVVIHLDLPKIDFVDTNRIAGSRRMQRVYVRIWSSFQLTFGVAQQLMSGSRLERYESNQRRSDSRPGRGGGVRRLLPQPVPANVPPRSASHKPVDPTTNTSYTTPRVRKHTDRTINPPAYPTTTTVSICQHTQQRQASSRSP